MSENDEILKEFLIESLELLDRVEQELVVLEKQDASREMLASIFRGFHTIKGTGGVLGYGRLESLTHAGESLLGRLRDGQLAVSPAIISALLATTDYVRRMLASIESSGSEGDFDFSGLLATLASLQRGESAAAAGQASPRSGPPAPAGAPPAAVPAAPVPAAPPSAAVAAPPAAVVPAAAAAAPALVAAASRAESEPAEAAEEDEPRQEERVGSAVAAGTIRVDVGLLEKLMNLVGELVLTRNQLLQYSTHQEDAGFLATSQRLNLITTELQEGVMKARMQPIGNVWNKFPRLVRDVALACGKRVRIEMEGRETELDRTIIEAIKDPLMHVLRNAIDHGIEAPDKRQALGKPSEGRLSLRAFHEGGQVNIEIADDGAGVDLARVRSRAVDRGLIAAETASRMSDREVLDLLFMPGFSTAEKVTNVSGRGVGMDVVKTNIERIGGTVDIISQPGEGTTLKLKIPLTLAIIPALVVSADGDRYAIPQVSLLELVRIEAGQQAIEQIHGAPVYRLRGNLLPLVRLRRELGLPEAPESDSTNIVVLQADDRQFGMVVDEVNDTEEIVVKPLGKQLKGIPTFAGATIMGDGRVALILDVLGLAQRAQVVAERRGHALLDKPEAAALSPDRARQRLLLVRGAGDGRLAIPLALVARLEEFAAHSVEREAGEEVVQYRGEIMPLLRLSALLGGGGDAATESGNLQVVVYSEPGTQVGLVVDQILDTVEEHLQLQVRSARPGVLGSAVIQGRVTEVLDIGALIRLSGRALRGRLDAPTDQARLAHG